MNTRWRSALPLLALSLVACGQKGPLYMPDTTQGEVVTRPTQAVARPAKVVALDSRRKARLEADRLRERQRPRPAA